SLLTPNRIGEYGAKALYFSPPDRKKVMVLNSISNTAQMLVTTLFGIIGILFFIRWHPLEIGSTQLLYTVGIVTGGMFVIILFLKTKILFRFKKKLIKKWKKLPVISKPIYFKVLLFSVLRYFIFSFQFFYLLNLLHVQMGYLETMMVISSMYLLASILPSLFLFDVVIKGGVAVYLFGLMGVPDVAVLTVVTLMWLFNVVLPSILGSYHVLRFQPSKAVT